MFSLLLHLSHCCLNTGIHLSTQSPANAWTSTTPMGLLHRSWQTRLLNIFRCNGGKGQQWFLQDGQLVNPSSGKCLDIYNPSELSPDQYKDEMKVQLLHCKGNPNQQWALVDQGFGRKHLVNIPSGKCLDIYSPSGNLDDDTQVQLFTCDGEKGNQRWRFDYLASSSQLGLFPTQRWIHHSDSTLSTDGQLCLDWTSKDGHSVYVSSCDPEHFAHHKWALSSDGKLSTDGGGSLVLDWTGKVGSDGYHAVYMNEASANLPHQRWRLSTDGALTTEGGAGLCLGWLLGGVVRMMPCQGLTSSNAASKNALVTTTHGKCEDDCMALRGYDYPTCRSICLGAASAEVMV